MYVLDKVGFSTMKTMQVKKVNLRTGHAYSFAAKLYNSDTYTHFECKQWRALCKAYAFEPDMLITFDIRLEDDIADNIDIWVNVQTPPVLPLYEFLNHSYVLDIVYSKIVDN